MASGAAQFWSFFDKYFIIIGITIALSIGLLLPEPGRDLKERDVHILGFTLPQVAVVIIFILSGLGLDSIKEVNKPLPLALGIFFVIFLTPLLAIPIKMFGAGLVKLQLLQGACLFCAVPTTLSSGVKMVEQAGGNVPLALVLTTSTNLLGVFTMPYLCSWIFSATVEIPMMPMLKQLVMQTLVPFVLGLGLSNIGAVKSFATKYKKNLGRTGNCCIFFVVWLMSSGAQAKIVQLPAKDLGMSAALAIFTHIVYRTGAYLCAQGADLPPKEWVTFVLMCSQKSLPVCVSVLSTLPASLQVDTGTFIIPCIMSHFSQLLIDAMLTVRWTIDEKVDSSYVKA